MKKLAKMLCAALLALTVVLAPLAAVPTDATLIPPISPVAADLRLIVPDVVIAVSLEVPVKPVPGVTLVTVPALLLQVGRATYALPSLSRFTP